jgi:nucleoside-diphosphate-sugar epimerase
VIELGSLTPTRDFTFVKDTVDAFITISESEKSIGEAINIGTGTEISIGDLAKKITGLVGKDLEVISKDKRKRPEKSEVNRLLADATKAKELLGWEPKHTLDEGLTKTIDWVKESLDRFQPGKYQI